MTTVPPQTTPDGKVISSSRVRAALLRGDVVEADQLLDRPYRLAGVVAAGQRRGQTLGFPTANLERVATLIPADGVYAVRAVIDAQQWPAATNIGPNPTFGEQSRKVEVHLIDFRGDLYGRTLEVDFVARLRATRPVRGSVAARGPAPLATSKMPGALLDLHLEEEPLMSVPSLVDQVRLVLSAEDRSGALQLDGGDIEGARRHRRRRPASA